MRFLFYAFYLLAAEFPVLLILYVRSIDNSNVNQVIAHFIYISILLNIIFCIFIMTKKEAKLPGKDVTSFSENNSSISDFFSFFLLPFFTFSLSASTIPLNLFLELGILFLLLTTLLYKRKSLSANIIFYALFTNYTISTTGRKNINILILTPLTIEDFIEDMDRKNLLKINPDYFLYCGNKKKNFYILIVSTIALLILLAVLTYFFDDVHDFLTQLLIK